MFNLFKRVKTVVGSELNAMLDKAEDPVKMLDQFMREMESDIRDAEASVAKQIANEKMLKKKTDDAASLMKKRESQAMQALQAGNDDLARRTLEDKKLHESEMNVLKESYERAKSDADLLRGKLDDMKKEYREMQLKKDALKARAESAKTRTKMNRAMSNISNDESKRGFGRMEEKVLRYEAEAETSEDISQESRSLDDEFAELNKNSGVDAELEELRKKMNKSE